MDRTYLQWNIVNWVTVVLMAAVGITLIGLIGTALKQYQGNSSSAAANTVS